MAEWDDEDKDFEREMALAMGERPESEANRVWVDHDGLEKAARTDDGLDDLWTFTGLGTLKAGDRVLPRPLRRLLRIYGLTDPWTLSLLLVPVTGIVLVVLAPWDFTRVFGVALVITSVALAAVGSVVLDSVQEWLGWPLPLTRRWRLIRTVRALREKPFVVVTEGKVVENLPSVSWLEARAGELKEAAEDAESRASKLDGIAERLRKARSVAGDTGPDRQLDHLAEAAAAERDLAGRATKLRGTLQARREGIRAQLAKLQARVDVEALHDQAAALTGEKVASTPEKVAADLEVDVADLAKDVSALEADIVEQTAHYAAMNEVSAL